jgi:hypothetical protein
MADSRYLMLHGITQCNCCSEIPPSRAAPYRDTLNINAIVRGVINCPLNRLVAVVKWYGKLVLWGEAVVHVEDDSVKL